MSKVKRQLKTKASTDVITIKESATQYIDLAQLIADTKAVPLLWGEGWDLIGEDSYGKQRLLEILDNNGVDGLLKTSEQQLSMREDGNQLWVVQPGYDGEILINIANMNNCIYQGDQNGHIEAARVSTFMQAGIFSFQVVQEFANGMMKTIINKKSVSGVFDSPISVSEYNNITGNKLVSNWMYGDQIPLIMFTNRSSAGLTDQGDAYSSRSLQDLLDTTMAISNNETITNTTKVLTKQLPSYIKSKKDMMSKLMENTFIQVDGQTDGMQILTADPKLDAYWSSINNIIDKYTIAAPYSVEADFNGTQTQVGVLFQGKKDIETTRIKKEARELQFNNLINLIVKVDAEVNIDVYNNDVFEVKINSFNVLEASDEDVRVEKMMSLGIITRRDVISHYYDTKDEEQIDEIIERLDTEGSFNSPSINNELDEEDKDIDDGGEE